MNTLHSAKIEPLSYTIAHWPIIIFLLGLIWAVITMYFDVKAHAGDISKVQQSIEKFDRNLDERASEVQRQLRAQAERNGRVEANQETTQRLLRDLIQQYRARNSRPRVPPR